MSVAVQLDLFAPAAVGVPLSDMGLWFAARAAGFVPSRRLCAPGTVALAEGWRADGEEWFRARGEQPALLPPPPRGTVRAAPVWPW